jgi:diguanylate cyclase (GGDEF)-like protein/PAS domain S-box-containing protein
MTQSRILIVDDEPGMLISCKTLLESAKFTVSTATSGAQALALLEENPAGWDLMLLDLNMPDQDGLAVMYELQKRGIDICVVVLSGETAFHWVSKAFQGGAFDYVRKPYEFDALVNTLKNALKKRELEKSFQILRKQLERSERLHRFMIESSPDIIFIVDKDGIFRFVNDRAEDLLGYRKDELLGEHYSVVVDPASIAKAAACFSERRASLRAGKDEEIWLLCKPGAMPGSERRRLAIELNAMGVYEHESVNERGEKLQRDYSGTYVVARDITERLASQKLIHYQAYHDLLTGLPNRALFLDRLSNAISTARRHKNKLTVMFLDLDRFKFVNDTLGHDVGDALLKQIAGRLKKCLRESDTLARIGGDEFIVLLPHVESITTAKAVAEKIVKAIKEPLVIANHELCVTTSVGISMYPQDGTTADALIKNADIAMYHTKDLGKDGFNIFTQELSALQRQQLSIESEIRRGIREQQFAVYYQPQVNAIDGSISGVEALLRWNHPERGLLTPAFFLPVAEESALIIELGDWVMEAALKDIQEWRGAGLEVGILAINFSFRQIEQNEFVDKIINSLKRYNFPSKTFEIEITESSLMSDADKTIAKLRQLNSFGVNIAIDDFGTGYSSLSLLQKLPINRLKIDRSFIQDLQTDSDRSIIEAIAHMAKGLKLDMVAEGVEQDFQLRYLRKLECEVVQGFIYSQCLSAAAMRSLLKERSALIAHSPRLLHSI